MARYLDQEFSEDEVKKTVFDINPSKAPGPDGYTAFFYHLMWDTLKEDITKATLDILNNGANLNN